MTFSLDALGPYLLVIVAGLFAHACYALPLSMLTLVSSHAIGKSASHQTVLRLSISYILGSLLATLGLLALLTYIASDIFPVITATSSWIVITILLVLVGWLTLLFYYRRGKGTKLWLPRRLIETLSAYAKRSTSIFDALGLGAAMVIIELPFLIAPLVLAGAILSTLPDVERNIGLLVYGIAAVMPMITVTVMMGGGYKLSTIQRWRESNKSFLQWTSGLTLILLGIYLFATNIWGGQV